MDKFIQNLAKGAGEILRQGFKSKVDFTTKAGHYDYLTKYDLLSEKYISDRIAKRFPNHGIIGEENGYSKKKSKSFWVIDPLDGTHAFVKGIPQFSVSISFVHNNNLEFASVYDPIMDESFFAEHGNGAYLNRKKIKVATKDSLYSSQAAPYVSSPYKQQASGRKMFKKFLNNILYRHRMWTDIVSSVALGCCYLACGRFDVQLAAGFNPWDLSAGGLIAREAGARVSEYSGKQYKWNSETMIAANPVLHKEVMDALKR